MTESFFKCAGVAMETNPMASQRHPTTMVLLVIAVAFESDTAAGADLKPATEDAHVSLPADFQQIVQQQNFESS